LAVEAGSLTDVEFEIDSAVPGQEGLAKVQHALQRKAGPYAMAFVDVRMPPGWDGIETISRNLGNVSRAAGSSILHRHSDYCGRNDS